jgi:hypothetical protein
MFSLYNAFYDRMRGLYSISFVGIVLSKRAGVEQAVFAFTLI